MKTTKMICRLFLVVKMTAIMNLTLSFNHENYIYKAGCQFITVDSLNNSRTNKFYSSHNFSNLSNSDFSCDTRRMYLLLQCVNKVQNDNETV